MLEADRIRLQHMLDAAVQANAFTSGKSRLSLDTDQMLVFALVKAIEIIGEAASKVSDECKAGSPSIAWSDIVGMRNRLIHGYFDINLDIVWTTVQEELPPLINQLKQALC